MMQTMLLDSPGTLMRKIVVQFEQGYPLYRWKWRWGR